MNEAMAWISALVAGVGLGLVFFGGLWWTVQKGASAKRPAFWFMASFLVRTGIVLAGFYLVSLGQGSRLLWCLLGFVAARTVTIHMLTPALERRAKSRSESRHAP